MSYDSLARSANQIGLFFESMPNRPEALEGIADHLKKFWAPSMLREFYAQIDKGEHGLSEIVLLAVTTHRAKLEPVAA
jgi:formate dehydrogenase subunit delta